MRYIAFTILFITIFQPAFCQDVSENKWEVSILTDAFDRYNYLYSLLYYKNSGEITFDRINTSSDQDIHLQFKANPSVLIGFKLQDNLELLVGMQDFPFIHSNSYLVGARISKDHQFLKLRYALGLKFDTGLSKKAHGVLSIISASYTYRDLVVFSIEHNTSLFLLIDEQKINKNILGLFLDAHPVLRIGVTF